MRQCGTMKIGSGASQGVLLMVFGMVLFVFGTISGAAPIHDILSELFPGLFEPVRGGDFWCVLHLNWGERLGLLVASAASVVSAALLLSYGWTWFVDTK